MAVRSRRWVLMFACLMAGASAARRPAGHGVRTGTGGDRQGKAAGAVPAAEPSRVADPAAGD